MAGVDLKTVQELLGRKTFEMTLRYSHLSPDHKRRAIEVLGRRMDTIWTPERETEEGFRLAYLPKFSYTETKESFVGVAELVDALGLGPSGTTRESSILSSDTNKNGLSFF